MAVVDRDQLLDERELCSVSPEQILGVDRLEGVGLQVDDVDLLRRIVDDLLRRDVDAQPRLAGRDEHRIIVAHAVDGARAETGNRADEAVLALDPGGPAELVPAERDAGEGGEEVIPHAASDDSLDHDSHLLV